MNHLKSFLVLLFIFPAILLSHQKALSQHFEIGVKVVLSGAIMFGPDFTFWIDDHNVLNASVLAAYEEKLIIPFAVNAGYSAYFFKYNWRPQIGLQYSYLISPRRHKSPSDPNGVSILSLTPGVQFRWDDTHQDVQSRIWIAYFLEKPPRDKKIKIFPLGLDFSYGYKFK